MEVSGNTCTQIHVIRFPNSSWDKDLLFQEAEKLTSQLTYKRSAKDADIPIYANCVTAVRHIMEKASTAKLVHDWVGNMPRAIVCKNGGQITTIYPEELQTGDLLFLKDHHVIDVTTHVAIALTVDKIFHCTDIYRGARIEGAKKLFSRYTQVDGSKTILAYIDPRTLEQYKEEEKILVTQYFETHFEAFS